MGRCPGHERYGAEQLSAVASSLGTISTSCAAVWIA